MRPADNLPRPLTRFIGRARQLAAVSQLLAAERLVTLVGPGGCGKSRLAVEAAARVRDRFPEGVWLVELDALTDPEVIPQAVATALGIQEEPGHPLLDTLASALAARKVLLVLDNCEHLIDACATFAHDLLRRTGARVLATSREPLGVPGEAVFVVPPLAVPDSANQVPPTDLTAIESVALFVDRARARVPDFTLNAETAPHVVAVCRRLDGLPLALELAAAAVGALPLDVLAAHLDTALDFLRLGPRTKPRHASLRATLDWSYDRLDPAAQTLLARLSVFSGSFGLSAATEVCQSSELPPSSVIGSLLTLVDRSLVLRLGQRGEPRYRLLEPVRQYAREQLARRGETGRIEDAHLRAFAAWSDRAADGLAGPAQGDWVERVRLDEDNLRSALRRATADPASSASTSLGLQLAANLARFWMVTRQWTEGRQWLARLLSLAPSDALARAKGLLWAAALALLAGDVEAVRDLAPQGIAWADQTGQPAIAGELRAILAVALANLGDTQARGMAEAGLAILRRLDEPVALGRALMGAGTVARIEGDPARAAELHRESARLLRDAGDRYFLAHTLSNLGLALLELGDVSGAEEVFSEALAERRALGDRQGIAWSLLDLGDAARARGRLPVARARYRESLALLEALGDRADASAVQRRLDEIGGAGRGAAAQPNHLTAPASSLTPRERDVLRLLAQGYTNRRIAEALCITEGTAGIHVQHVLAKLGFSSRAQAAAWAVSHGLADAPASPEDVSASPT
jgi:predicted ATPase/DNA-binding CsgD family transcriptional regulator